MPQAVAILGFSWSGPRIAAILSIIRCFRRRVGSSLALQICNEPAGTNLAGFFIGQEMSNVLDFDKENGLIAAVVQDAATARVLMVGYMNREAFDKTIATGHVTFFSRSRHKLWTKGESSGHFLNLKSISTDCDGDALLVSAEVTEGGVCHNGYNSCFYRTLQNGEWVETENKVYDPSAVYGAKR